MFRIAHISDPHLPPPVVKGTWRELASKRTLSRLAWRRKRRQHDPQVLARLIADIRAYAPDHLAITGDLTNFSTAAEVAAARDWLESLGPRGGVTFTPGNHDVLVADGRVERFTALRPWFGDDAGPGEADFPHIRRLGGVAIVNLCSARPSSPLLAIGRIGETQLGRAAERLAELGSAGVVRIVMLHHPVVDGVVSRRKALVDAAALRAVLRTHGAELVLHGHVHEAVFGAVTGPHGPIPVLSAPSASSPPNPHHAAARWHAVEIDAGARLTVIARGLDPRTGEIGELGRYVLADPAS